MNAKLNKYFIESDSESDDSSPELKSSNTQLPPTSINIEDDSLKSSPNDPTLLPDLLNDPLIDPNDLLQNPFEDPFSNTETFEFKEEFFKVIVPSYSEKKVNELAMMLMSAHRETLAEKSPPQMIIDAEGCPTSPPKSNEAGKKFWIQKLNLQEKDQHILSSSTQWLTDDIIDASQHVLASQFPENAGFQEVSKGLCYNFTVEPSKFVQTVLHDGYGHWLMISTVDVQEGEEEQQLGTSYENCRWHTGCQKHTLLNVKRHP